MSVRIIDTRGIDRTAARADLEAHLDDPHTLAVLCSGYNNAPAAEARLLLERARDIGVRSLEQRAALLVLPRPNEALAAKDESGIRVDTTEEGYVLKEEQVTLALQPLGLRELPVGFFNAHEDSPERLHNFLVERIANSREMFRVRLAQITENARTVLANQEQEQVQEVLRHAATMLRSWAIRSRGLRPVNAKVQDSLMTELVRAHSSTIRATIRREGEWPNLSYSHHLGYGARRLAVLSLGQTVDGFSELCQTMIANPDFSEAQDLIKQAERVLVGSYEELLRKVQLMGQTSFRDELKIDVAFWVECESEWGQGRGYRDRVAGRNTEWFGAQQRQELGAELLSLVVREWESVLENVTSLFDADPI